MKRLAMTITAVITVGLLSGCETTMSDQNRTRTEGAAAGAVIGGLLGWAIDRERGAAIGALLGAGAGLAVGDQIARRKQQYATTEDFLEAQIVDTARLNADARAHNNQMRQDTRRLDREAQALRARYDAGAVRQNSLVAKRAELREQIQSGQNMEAKLAQEYEFQTAVLAQEREQRPKNDPYLARLEREVQALQTALEQTRQGNVQLANIDQRLSV